MDCFEDDCKREKLFGGGDGCTLSKEGQKALLDHWLEAVRSTFEGMKAEEEAMTKRLEEVQVSGEKDNNSEEEFHEAEEDVAKTPEVEEDSSSSSVQTEFREKENDEKMEKELEAATKKQKEEV